MHIHKHFFLNPRKRLVASSRGMRVICAISGVVSLILEQVVFTTHFTKMGLEKSPAFKKEDHALP